MRAWTLPHQFASDNLRIVRQHWVAVCDGDAEAIHLVRIATRRLRAALAVIDDPKSERRKTCRRLGRALGRVREADATHELLIPYATRVPEAACALAALLRRVAGDQRKRRRSLARTLDELVLRPLVSLGDLPGRFTPSYWRHWRVRIIEEIRGAANAVQAALDRAPAVYLPHRLHRVRIAVKKMRYALELAASCGITTDDEVAHDLRKMQGLLGRVHDIHVARERLDALRRMDMIENEARLLDAVMSADCHDLYEKYERRRDRLREIASHCLALSAAQLAAPAVFVRRTLPAAAVALPAAIVVHRLHGRTP